MIEIYSWTGNVAVILGILLIAYQIRLGFILGCIGGALWMIKGIYTDQYDLIFMEAIVICLQAFSWWQWGREDKCKIK